MPNPCQPLSRLIQGGVETAAASQPDMINTLVTMLNAVIASDADPYLVSAALTEGLAVTVAQKVPEAKQGDVALEVVRLLRDRMQFHRVI